MTDENCDHDHNNHPNNQDHCLFSALDLGLLVEKIFYHGTKERERENEKKILKKEIRSNYIILDSLI